MLSLKVINLFAGPGAGKTTTAAGLFNLMKLKGHEVELVSEYAKDLTYEKHEANLSNQLLILAQQDSRLRRLEGHVEWAITDSPLPLSLQYITPEYEEWLEDAVWGAYDRYVNHNVLIKRVKPYQKYGRTQTESEALVADIGIRDIMKEAEMVEGQAFSGYLTVDGDATAPHTIYRQFVRKHHGTHRLPDPGVIRVAHLLDAYGR